MYSHRYDIPHSTRDFIIQNYAREAGVRSLKKFMNKISEKIAFKIVESEADTGTYGNIDISVDKDLNLEEFIGAPVFESKRFYEA